MYGNYQNRGGSHRFSGQQLTEQHVLINACISDGGIYGSPVNRSGMPIPDRFAIEWLASGGFVFLLGALIKFAGWTWLLAGYSESTSPVPDDVVRDMAGNSILRIGIAVVVFGVLASLIEPPSYLSLVVEGAILLAVVRLLYRLNTWAPQQAA